MTNLFSTEQLADLAAPLDRSKVRQREQGRTRVSYLEGWQVIAEANRIFGFDGWQRETVELRCVSQAERSIGRDSRPGWGVTYTARVRITIGGAPGAALLVREGSGAGHGIDADLGLAHESALKEAETDAMKRALMTFGNPFGLALYDRQQRDVTRSAAESPRAGGDASRERSQASTRPQQPHVPTNGQEPSTTPMPSARVSQVAELPASSTPSDPGQTPLDPAVIQQLLAALRALPRPELERFNRAFRLRFAIPSEAPTIADRICEQQHHDWIEAWLIEHQSVAA